MPTIRLALVGVGNVGQGFLQLLLEKGADLRQRYRLDLRVVAAADTSGIAINPAGLDPAELLALKADKKGVAHSRSGHPGAPPAALHKLAQADVLIEATLTDLKTGQPGLDLIRTALSKGMHVVSANKGPLVLAYRDLTERAANSGRQLRFSAAVCSGLPTVNIGQRDLVACQIERMEGVFNSTTNYILDAMTTGASFDDALAEAQRVGVAETDPNLDIDGWDTANKLIILANSVLNYPATLDDVSVKGIREINAGDLQTAQAKSQVIKLLASAVRQPDQSYILRVGPTALPADHPLARTRGWEMGIVYSTDIMGVLSAVVDERGPVPTGAAILRDVVSIYRSAL